MSNRKAVVAILDIGKTNKKAFLFDEDYKIVYEQTERFAETIDEEGDPCEDISKMIGWVAGFEQYLDQQKEFDIKAINVSTYGASFVHIDREGALVGRLSNYLKPYPSDLLAAFYQTYGDSKVFSLQTSSPVLGNLNSGLQLYRLKKQAPNLFTQVHYSLHLPQFIIWLLTAQAFSDITSIGCHTGLWDFERQQYHSWVAAEGIVEKLPPVFPSDGIFHSNVYGDKVTSGVGLHDSSAALIPYLYQFHEDFILISSGTWSITLNPFNKTLLTSAELDADCLCYLDYKGNSVKASRFHAGYEHDKLVAELSTKFKVPEDQFLNIEYNSNIVSKLKEGNEPNSYKEAYHAGMMAIVSKQVLSTQLVVDGRPSRIFVDGGFSHNQIFMRLLAATFSGSEVYAASVAQASALGAALAIHPHWNSKKIPGNLIETILYEE